MAREPSLGFRQHAVERAISGDALHAIAPWLCLDLPRTLSRPIRTPPTVNAWTVRSCAGDRRGNADPEFRRTDTRSPLRARFKLFRVYSQSDSRRPRLSNAGAIGWTDPCFKRLLLFALKFPLTSDEVHSFLDVHCQRPLTVQKNVAWTLLRWRTFRRSWRSSIRLSYTSAVPPAASPGRNIPRALHAVKGRRERPSQASRTISNRLFPTGDFIPSGLSRL